MIYDQALNNIIDIIRLNHHFALIAGYDHTLQRNNMELISVYDRFPEEGQKVLFHVLKREEIYSGYFGTDSYRQTTKSSKFREIFEDWWFEDETVTHWMRLPQSPRDSHEKN